MADQLLNNLRGCCAFNRRGESGGSCEQVRRIGEFCTTCEAASRLEQTTDALSGIVATYGPSTDYDPNGPVMHLWVDAERALRRCGR